MQTTSTEYSLAQHTQLNTVPHPKLTHGNWRSRAFKATLLDTGDAGANQGALGASRRKVPDTSLQKSARTPNACSRSRLCQKVGVSCKHVQALWCLRNHKASVTGRCLSSYR